MGSEGDEDDVGSREDRIFSKRLVKDVPDVIAVARDKLEGPLE